MGPRLGAKAWIPVAVLALGLGVSVGLVAIQPRSEARPVAEPLALVPVVRVHPAPVRLGVRAHGTVAPRTETDLVLEVAGRIVWTSPQLEAGGRFREGELLLRIDSRDYEVARERAAAAADRAESLAALARTQLERQRTLRRADAASAAALDEAASRARVAEANLREARALLAQAELDLSRTGVRAPFTGQVRERHLAVGQFAARGAAAARIFETSDLEVRLPIPSHELAYLDVSRKPGPEVRLTGEYGGRRHEWLGRVVRTEGTLDPQTRMVALVAHVDATSVAPGEEVVPLPVGLFVDAVVEGRLVDDALELPRGALRADGRVVVVEQDAEVRFREVELLRADGDRIWLRGGLEAGERVVVSGLGLLREGMKVRTELARLAAPVSPPPHAPASGTAPGDAGLGGSAL